MSCYLLTFYTPLLLSRFSSRFVIVYALFCVSSFGCEFGLCGIVMVSFSAVWQRLLLLFVGVVGGWVGYY